MWLRSIKIASKNVYLTTPTYGKIIKYYVTPIGFIGGTGIISEAVSKLAKKYYKTKQLIFLVEMAII